MPVLDWLGKNAVINHHNEVPYRLIHYNGSLSSGDKASGNLLVQGDNLLALKALLPHYAGQVKCIYIDPPYNTGNEGWVYNDNVNSAEIRKWLGKVVGKEVEDLSRHDKWLCMMYPRLQLLKEFLRDDGVIFVSIDDNAMPYLRLLMDEIYDGKNFVAQLPTIMNLKGNNDQFGFSGTHEYTLVYAREINKLSLGSFSLNEEEFENWQQDDKGFFKQGANLKATGIDGSREKRPNLYFPIYISDNLDVSLDFHSGWNELLPITNGQDMRWRWSKEKFSKDLDEVIVTRTKEGFSIYKKQRPSLGDLPSTKPKSLFYKPSYSSGNGTALLKDILGDRLFNNPKPLDLIKDFLVIGSILDSFAGSGTTGHAVLQANAEDGGNRRFILVEMDKTIAQEVTAQRLTKVIGGYFKNGDTDKPIAGLGGGFRFCRLGKPLFDEWGELMGEATFSDIAAHVFFIETGCPIPKKASGDTPFIGAFNGKAVYLLYSAENTGMPLDGSGNILTPELLPLLKLPPECEAGSERVVYAEHCTLNPVQLEQEHIAFRQIPYHLTKEGK